MSNNIEVDPLEFASSIDDRNVDIGHEQGRQHAYDRGFPQGFSRGLDYAMENHREIAVIAAYCTHQQEKLGENPQSDHRQVRLLNGIVESCREFRTLSPDTPRYAELFASIRARHQHLTGTTNQHSPEIPSLAF